MKRSYSLWINFIIYVALLARLDRLFFKNNACFCIHYIQRGSEDRAVSILPPPTPEQDKQLDALLSQPFTYLARGLHCYAFLSQDQKTVLKFHRIPPPQRQNAWIIHPFSAHSEKIQRFSYFIDNYNACYTDLQKEIGCLWLHTQPSPTFKKSVTLIDKAGNYYSVRLNDTTFILQSTAQLVYPALQSFDIERAKNTLTQIVELLATSFQKGYIHADPAIQKNFGLLPDRAIFIDFGDVIKHSTRQNLPDYLKKATSGLNCWLQNNRSDLLEHFEAEIQRLSAPL